MFWQVGEDPEPKIDLPPSMKRCENLKHLISTVYPGIREMGIPAASYMTERTILCPRNDDVMVINQLILQSYRGIYHSYLAADKADENLGKGASAFNEDNPENWPNERLNQQNPHGFPPFKLDLKVGCPVMLLRNIAPTNGMCKDTRMRVEICMEHVIVATILTGDKAGEVIFIPRISLTPSASDVAVQMTRRQFPIRLAYAMTINKSHGQFVRYVGIYLRISVFSHGQLYVALSRCTVAKIISLLLLANKTGEETDNVVYPSHKILWLITDDCYFGCRT